MGATAERRLLDRQAEVQLRIQFGMEEEDSDPAPLLCYG
jgi:hypothetical protein